MKNPFKIIKEEKQELINTYTKDERENALTASLVFTFIYSLPIVLICIAVFNSLVMRPYLAFFFVFLSSIWIAVIGFILYNSALKKLKDNENKKSFTYLFLFRFILVSLILAILVLVVALIVSPLFFL